MKNYINHIFYPLIIFISCFYFLNAYLDSQYDSLHFYEFFKKVDGGEVLYKDYIIWHGPYIIYFFKLLSLIGASNYFIFVLLGFFQQLLAAYLAVLFSKKIKIDSHVQNISFLITFLLFSLQTGSLYWDYYAPLCGFWGLYYFFVRNNNKFGIFLIVLTFFLKQSFGFSFVLFSLIFCLFLQDKRKKLGSIYLLFIIFFLINFIIIFFISDFKNYIEYSILFLFTYFQNSYNQSFFGFFETLILQYIFLLPNVKSFNDFVLIFKNYHIGFWSFYIIFKIPIFFIYFYILKNFKKINYDPNKILIILLAGSLIVLPILGRGFMLTTYYTPLAVFLLLHILNYRILGKIYFLMVFMYTLMFFLYENKFLLNSSANLRSESAHFMTFNNNQLINLNVSKKPTKELIDYIKKNDIKNIYTLDNKARISVWFSNQKTLNKDLYFYAKSQPKYFSYDFFEELNKDIIKKNPKYIVYNNNEFVFFKKKVRIEIIKKYIVAYNNYEYTLLKKIND